MRSLVIGLALLSEQASAGLPVPQGAPLVSVEQRGYAVEAYRVDGTPAEALASYRGALRDFEVRTIHGALAVRGRETAIVHAYRDGDHTVLALVRLGDDHE